MALVCLVIPNTRETVRRSLDLPGLCLLVLFLVSLLLALTQGQQYGWDTPYIQRLLLTAGVSFVLFVTLEWWQREPLVDLRLYTNLRFAGISLAIFLNSMTFWGTGFLQTILLQRLLDYTPALAGFVGVSMAPALAQGGAPLKIVAFGDSLTAGYGLPAQDTFPARLQAALKAKGLL